MTLSPFHLAIPVHDLELARNFYDKVLKLERGRSDVNWTDYNFYGHQLVIHYKPKSDKSAEHYGNVDGHSVPVPHFGVILPLKEWKELANRIKHAGINFIIDPYIRFEGEVGEQATMFFHDPCGNALEFKSFNDLSKLFEK